MGKYVGEQALAAVGTSTPIMNIAILLISGMCMGASVLMSSQYGAKDYDTLSRQISTTMLAGCGFSVVFSLLMLLLANPVLRLIRVPETAIPEAAAYLHDDDRRNCVLHCGHVVLHSFCQTVIITDSGAGGSASACSFLSENRVFGIYFYIYL